MNSVLDLELEIGETFMHSFSMNSEDMLVLVDDGWNVIKDSKLKMDS